MTCDELKGSYELYALGLLNEPERGEAEEHLGRGCPVCTEELRRAISMNVLVFAGAPDAVPSAKLRSRILASVGAEEKKGWAWLPWATTALATGLLVVMFVRSEGVQRDKADVARLREIVGLLTEPETRQVTFGKGPQGRVLVNPKRGVLLIASNLPPVGAGKTYAFWIIPKGGAPRPAGLFQSDSSGNALHQVPGPVNLAETGAVAVSVEPEGGSPAPTTTPIIVAPLAE
jgi:hypothetical protein